MRDSYKYYGVDFTGKKHGRLTVIRKADTGRTQWVCRCECGNEVTLPVCKFLAYKSCGCLERENRENLASYSRTHEQTNSILYSKYYGMRYRCYDPKYKHYDRYGGRGIKVCDEWMGENGFLYFCLWAYFHGYKKDKKGYGQTLDRIDVNGDYTPENCRWVSQKEQMHNIGRTLYMEYNGKTIPVIDFCQEHGITYIHFVLRKLEKGISPEQIIKEWDIKYSDDHNGMMTIDEASQHYNVCKATIVCWLRKGLLKSEKAVNTIFIYRNQPRPYFRGRDLQGHSTTHDFKV